MPPFPINRVSCISCPAYDSISELVIVRLVKGIVFASCRCFFFIKKEVVCLTKSLLSPVFDFCNED